MEIIYNKQNHIQDTVKVNKKQIKPLPSIHKTKYYATSLPIRGF